MDSLRAARSPLHHVALQAAAGAGWTVRLHAAADSTNALAATDPEPQLVVVADHQQAGRGRLDRAWVTPPGAALTFSAVCDPRVDAEWWPLIPLVAGIAVARVTRGSLKWPNDVLLGDGPPDPGHGRKVCGILVERVHTQPPLAVIGIGINVDQVAEELPVETATSLALESQPRDRTELFAEVLGNLRTLLGVLASRPETVTAIYRGLCSTLGREVRAELPGGETVSGVATDVDDHGRLLVRTDAGIVPIGAGDVVHLRAGG